eukprot:scaffold6302_cov61-Cyclotella_meneghiniana.AAC.7
MRSSSRKKRRSRSTAPALTVQDSQLDSHKWSFSRDSRLFWAGSKDSTKPPSHIIHLVNASAAAPMACLAVNYF